jgi:hypothetical protein
MRNLTATTTIAKRENLSVNIGIIACIAMILVSLSACEVEDNRMRRPVRECETDNSCRRYDPRTEDSTIEETEPEALRVVGEVLFDLESKDRTSPRYYNDVHYKTLPINLYVEDNELLLHDWVFDMSISSTAPGDINYNVVDWENTIIRLNGEVLNPDIEILESSNRNSTIKVTWVDKSYRSLYGENHIEIEFVFSEDVPVYTSLTVWTKSMLFQEVGTDDYYLGGLDVNLGQEGFSGVLHSEDEQHSVGGSPMFLIVD